MPVEKALRMSFWAVRGLEPRRAGDDLGADGEHDLVVRRCRGQRRAGGADDAMP